jgi:hypothetical protein
MSELLIGILIGLGAGVVVTAITVSLLIDRWYVGNLNLDASIPEEPYYFIEVSRGMTHKLSKNKHVLLNVRKSNYEDRKETK